VDIGSISRRGFVQLASASIFANTTGFCAATPRLSTSKQTGFQLRLGTVANVRPGTTVDAAIKRVHDLGLSVCQIFFEHLELNNVKPLQQAMNKYSVEVCALSEHNPGRRIFNFYDGPRTIGVIPPDTRRARIDALKLAADFARISNIPSVHTHLGFIPEDPNDSIYPQAIKAIRGVAEYCGEQGLMLLCETGEETPITMLRMIQDVGTKNIFVNLDTANLILYGKGNPVDAMDVFGHLVRGVHAKDGLFPTDPHNLGKEVKIGKGRVDFLKLFKRLGEVNYSGPIIIEREIEGYEQERDILQSESYLKNLIAKSYR
jgi:L-ribulose-5-phosphate 3-epimerase